MSKEKFDILLSLVGLLLTKRHYFSRQRSEITPADRLAVTLRYLPTGNSQVSLSFNFRIGRSTICGIVRETSQAIWDALKTLYVRAPSNQQELNGISDQFAGQWNFRNCIGADDGKHIVVQAPSNSVSVSLIQRNTLDRLDGCVRYILSFYPRRYWRCGSAYIVMVECFPTIYTFGKADIEGTLPLPPDCSLPGIYLSA